MGSAEIPVLFAGAQGTDLGLDQINIGPLPASLAGSGEVNLVLTADGEAANITNVTIKQRGRSAGPHRPPRAVSNRLAASLRMSGAHGGMACPQLTFSASIGSTFVARRAGT